MTAVAEGHELDLNKQTRSSETECFLKDTWIAATWTNQAPTYSTDSGNCELGFVQLPQEDDAVAPSNWLKPTLFWSVPSSAQNPDLAVEFINWFTNEKAVFDIVQTDRGVPIDAEMSAYVSTLLEGIPAQAAEFISWMGTEGEVGEMPVDTNPKAAEVRALFVEYCEGVWLGATKDLEKAATDFMTQANALLAEGAN